MKFSINAFIYKNFIDRILSVGQKHIILKLSARDSVLDVACGTGSLSIAMSAVASRVSGIDLSEEMIKMAKDEATAKNVINLSFDVEDASDLSAYSADSFDVAVTSMAIHQFDPDLAVRILTEMKRMAKRVIIMDYYYPMRFGITRAGVYFIEWIAGGDHYRNFRKYNKFSGLDHYISSAGLEIISDLHPIQAFRVVECR